VILTSGTAEELIRNSGTATLEDAFLKLTGETMRDQEAGSADQLRNQARAWGKR
jgi:ABC-2 type transport system ATP-binding protein